MQTMQAATTLQVMSGQVPVKKTPTIEAGGFSAQLTQLLQQAEKQLSDSKKEPAFVEEQPEELVEGNQEPDHTDTMEEQNHSEVGLYFQQPLMTAEQQLAIHFEPTAVGKITVENNEVQAPKAFVPLGNQEEMTKQNSILPLKDNGVFPTHKIGQQSIGLLEGEAATKQVGAIFAKNSPFTEKEISGDDKAIELILSKAEGNEKGSVEQVVAKKDSQLATVTEDKFNNGQEKPLLNNDEHTMTESASIVEQTEEETKLKPIESKQNELTDLDVQSALRMKVSTVRNGAATMEAPVTQQPMVQKETVIPVALTNESQAVNQQVLSQSVSEVVMDQVTTIQKGQQTTARLDLTPETLGSIKIEVQMKDNQLQTIIVVESSETKEMLDNSMQQLTKSLAQKNIHLQEITIQLSLPQESGFSFAESNSQQNTQKQDSDPATLFFEPVDQAKDQTREEEVNTSAGRISILA